MIDTKNIRRTVLFALTAGAAVAAAVTAWRSGVFTAEGEQQWAMIETYCVDCHNSLDLAGGVSFEGMSPEQIASHAETFETAVTKLRGRLMPPPGGPQPEQTQVDEFVAWLENTLDENPRIPRAGHVPVQRLSRTEYAAAVEDLLGIEIDPEQHLPTDIEVDGFTNIAAALSVSPAFLEQYIGTARTVARLAVGEPVPKMSSAYFPPPVGDQDGYADGLPLGTRGGTRFEHIFPVDGEYRLTITDLDVGLYPRALETEHTVVVLVDREEVFRANLGGPEDLAFVDRGGAPARAELMERFKDISFKVPAGSHEVIVTFIERSRAATDGPIYGFQPYGGFSFTGEMRVPRIVGGIEVKGPFDAYGLSRTESRDRIFICEPETHEDERACAERIAANLARRAFRRPVEQADVDRLMPFFEAGREGPGGFDQGIEQLVTAVLSSPDFLYRAVAPPNGIEGGELHALDDLELATRLSFFLWSQGPDDELLELAAADKLDNSEVLEGQVRRMLADSRAAALVENFALNWLNLDDLDEVVPDERLFPDFDDELRQHFETEIALFLESILLEDRNVQQLLTANHTYLNERLARHYGIDSVKGSQFRRVTLEDPRRHGLLGKGAVLLRTSYGDRTSPVLRGAWVLEKLMGTPPAPPPPNVETDLSTREGERPTTIRARLEQHRESSTCNGCHGVIDPYGLALENFTAVGEWREYDQDADAPIDAGTMLPGEIPIEGPVELRQALLRRPDQFVQALTQKMMMYALGRELEYFDMPQVRAIVRDAAEQDYRFSAIVSGIVASDAFRLQAMPVTRNDESAQDPEQVAATFDAASARAAAGNGTD